MVGITLGLEVVGCIGGLVFGAQQGVDGGGGGGNGTSGKGRGLVGRNFL